MAKMDKKGMFLPMFVIITPLILSALFVVMWNAEKEKESFVGIRAINMIKIEDEMEKAGLYAHLVVQYSITRTVYSLDTNGGYSDESSCKKTEKTLTDQDQYIILNTCPLLDTKKEFQKQFKKELKFYLDRYESAYIKNEDEDSKEDKTNYQELYSNVVRKAVLLEFGEDIPKEFRNGENREFSLDISDFIYPIEGNQESTMTVGFNFLGRYPELEYEEIYKFVAANCIKKDLLVCKSQIKSVFQKAEISNEDSLVKVKIPREDVSVIKFAFYNDQDLHSFIA